MYYLDAYKICPLCGSELKHDPKFAFCDRCGHRMYNCPRTAVNVLIFNENDELCLIVRKIDPFKGHWGFPGGFIDGEESVQEAARREVKEELGVDAEIGEIVYSSPAKYEYKGLIYNVLALYLIAKVKITNFQVGDDVSNYKFFRKQDLASVKIAWPEIQEQILLDVASK